MSLTRGHSCIVCQQRKVRCDQKKPCATCVRAQVECRVAPPQPAKRRRKKKVYEQDLLDRLKRYETLLTQNGISFDSLSDDQDGSFERRGPSNVESSSGAGIPDQNSSVERERQRNLKWFAYYDEYRSTDDLLDISTDEEQNKPTIHHAFDTMFSDVDSFPFMVGGVSTPITHIHPSTIQIFQLWQVYLNNVNPLLKIFHASILQVQIVEAGANLAGIAKPLEALMFSIYFIAVESMAEEEVQRMFGEVKPVVLNRYCLASQQALVNAEFMRSNDVMVLQAFLLYLLSLGCNVDPRNLFCLIGIAVRIATRLGLHRDGARFGLSPFEAEQRRRTWWQLVILDKRIAEMTGSRITAISSCGSECRLPLNVNDSELHPDSKTPPKPSDGFTEMSFSLTRIDLTLASAPGSIRPRPFDKTETQATPDPGSKSLSSSALDNIGDIEDYSSYFDLTYTKHCDPKVPIQKLTMTAIKIGICKLHVVSFMCRGIPASKLEKSARDELFIKSIEMLECDDAIYTSDELRGFRWCTQLQVPFPGYIFLASELVHRSSGELCERAWQAIFNNHDHRGLHRKLQSPMHRAFGHTLLKAWASREQAQLHLGRENEPPKLIRMLREVLSSDSNGNNTETGNINADSTGPYIGTQSSSGLENTFNVLGMPYIGDIDTGIEPNLFFSEQTDWMCLAQNGALEVPFGFDGPRST